MPDLVVPEELRPVEHRLRATLAAVAAATPVPDDDAPSVIAPNVVPIDGRRVRPARRWAAAAAAAVALAGAGTALNVATVDAPARRVTVGGAGDTATTAPVVTAPGPTAVAPAGPYLLPEWLPAGHRQSFAGRPSGPVSSTSRIEVFTEPAAGAVERAIAVLRTDRHAALGAVLGFEPATSLRVGGRPATTGSYGVLRAIDLSEGSEGLAVVGRGVSEEDLARVATAVRRGDVDVAPAMPAGFVRSYEGRHPLVAAPGDDVVQLNYASTDGLQQIDLTLHRGTAADVDAFAWHQQGAVEPVTVRGNPGVLVAIVDPDHGGRTYRQLMWSEGDLTVVLGGVDAEPDVLDRVAGSLRGASRAEIDELIDAIAREYSED